MKIIKTASYKKAQLDIVRCVKCRIAKKRDQMANDEVCYDCNDRNNYENS